MQKYIALTIFVFILRVIGGIIAVGSIGLSVIIFSIGYTVGDIPLYLANPLVLMVMAGIGVLIGFAFFALADYFEATIDTAENTRRIAEKMDVLIIQGVDHE